MTRERFAVLVEDALREIPRRFRNAMQNVAVIVEDAGETVVTVWERKQRRRRP